MSEMQAESELYDEFIAPDESTFQRISKSPPQSRMEGQRRNLFMRQQRGSLGRQDSSLFSRSNNAPEF